MDPERPGDFNQAMMELGATVCAPGRLDLPHAIQPFFRAAGLQAELAATAASGPRHNSWAAALEPFELDGTQDDAGGGAEAGATGYGTWWSVAWAMVSPVLNTLMSESASCSFSDFISGGHDHRDCTTPSSLSTVLVSTL